MSDAKSVAVLHVDSDHWHDAELDAYDPSKSSVFVYVKLTDGTEERFFIPERLLHRANYFNDTAVGTNLKVRLIVNEKTGRLFVTEIQRNPVIPSRPDARTLPWFKACYTRNDSDDISRNHLFVTVDDAKAPYFSRPTDVFLTRRLLRQYGYGDSLEQNQIIYVRLVHGERGLSVVQIQNKTSDNEIGEPNNAAAISSRTETQDATDENKSNT